MERLLKRKKELRAKSQRVVHGRERLRRLRHQLHEVQNAVLHATGKIQAFEGGCSDSDSGWESVGDSSEYHTDEDWDASDVPDTPEELLSLTLTLTLTVTLTP